MRRPILPAAALAASLLLSACGGSAVADGSADEPAAPPVAGMCAEDMPDCDDTADDTGGDAAGDTDGSGVYDSEADRERARGLLGLTEADLAPEIRIGRRGDEHMMLTEDYVIGRMTVELDADADGTFRVTAVTVELPDGPETLRD